MFGVSGRGVGGCRLGRSGLRVEIKDLGVMGSFDVAGLGSSCRAKDGLKPGKHGGKVKERRNSTRNGRVPIHKGRRRYGSGWTGSGEDEGELGNTKVIYRGSRGRS